MFSKICNLQFVICVLILLTLTEKHSCYEKTLRKIVRNQSKMVQRPFSDTTYIGWNNKTPQFPHAMIFPGYAQVKTVIHKSQRPKISTILSSVETSRSKSYSKLKVAKSNDINNNDVRPARNVFDNFTHPMLTDTKTMFNDFNMRVGLSNDSYPGNIALETFYHIPATSKYFPHVEKSSPNNQEHEDFGNNTITIPAAPEQDSKIIVKSIFNSDVKLKSQNELFLSSKSPLPEFEVDNEKPDFILEEVPVHTGLSTYHYNVSMYPHECTSIPSSKTNIDALKKFAQFDLETWVLKKQYWNTIFNSRYEYLMRNPKWPSLKVILVPCTHVDTIWKRSFEEYHNNSVNAIILNIVKKLKFYTNLTFQWNEVSHLSYWWKSASQKSRAIFRKLVKGGRLEITTGGWVETDEATADLFGLIHLLIEGHQWLKVHINFSPKVAWLTSSVSHSSTMPYLLAASGISKLVLTNLHYSWEKYLAEYQLSDFIWVQDWDRDRSSDTILNEDLSKMGNDRYPKHSVFTHYLQFNSADLRSCGPDGDVCVNYYDFGKNNINLDIDTYNIKNKSEMLLEQYSKTGTITAHNIVIAPIGGPYHYESQSEFDFQYNNYKKIVDFINANHEIYRTTVEFGTPSDYFKEVFRKHKSYPTLKGDFLNFADIKDGSPAYWTGYFTSRPLLKISIRRLQSTLRTTELLFSFAMGINSLNSINCSYLSSLVLKARETIARLQDRNVVSGTLSANALKYVNNQIVATVRDCWHIQEVAASLLSVRPGQNKTYLQKYVYRDGEFTSSFRSVAPGDQIYVFNSLSHERTDVVELATRYPNVKIVDHNKKEVTIQINPIWKYSPDNLIKISRDFFRINFVITVPPMTLELFKIKETYDAVQSASSVYCIDCVIEDTGNSGSIFPFNVQPIELGDIQLENYKHRLVFDEFTGFLKSVVDKETNTEKTVMFDYGAFQSASENSGMFLFNTNVSRPLYDILLPFRVGSKAKIMIIVSGHITTELTSIYGRLLQHTVKIFNLMNSPLSSTLYIESKTDLGVSPSNRELELFFSVQTDIGNGNHPEIFIDNNGFQYTPRVINISRRVESNMYPMTNMAFIQDQTYRLTIMTDHAQGVTALQEGQLVVMLDRRVLYNDGRGTNEGLADSGSTIHRHYILLEKFVEPKNNFESVLPNNDYVLPSLSARYLSNALNYILEIYLIEKNVSEFCYYAFLPLVKVSFPCDVALVNYRAIYNKQLEKTTLNSALMILHRQTFTCRIDYSLNQFCNGEPLFNLEKILRNVKAIYRTNLVGTSDNVPIAELDHFNFPPMELITLRIYFS